MPAWVERFLHPAAPPAAGLTSWCLLCQAELRSGQEKERLVEALRGLERGLKENQEELQSLQVRGHNIAPQLGVGLWIRV